MKRWLRRLARRARALAHRDSLERDLDTEMRHHIEMEAEDIAQERGIATSEARRQALVAFGGVSRFKEDHRDVRGVRWIEETAQDLRYAARSLRRSPSSPSASDRRRRSSARWTRCCSIRSTTASR